MPADPANPAQSRRRDRRRPAPGAGPTGPEPSETGVRVVAALVVVGAVCLAVGCARRGFEWKVVLAAAGLLAAGVSFLAIGALELEWLERLVGFIDGILGGLAQWFWTSWRGTLAERIGRTPATVFWVLTGSLSFLWGCLLALRVVRW
jgi:hypothetical protein